MDNVDLLVRVIDELPLSSLLQCRLVDRRWSRLASTRLERYHFRLGPDDDRLLVRGRSLRAFSLSSRTDHLLGQLHHLGQLRSFSVNIDASLGPEPVKTLSDILGGLRSLQHLYISGQPLKTRTRIADADERVARMNGVAEILRHLAHKRDVPGLTTLAITACPEFDDQGLCSFLCPGAVATEGNPGPDQRDPGSPGTRITHLTLAGCGKLGPDSLLLIAGACPNLLSLDCKDVNGLFALDSKDHPPTVASAGDMRDAASGTSGRRPLAEFAQRCTNLTTLSLSIRSTNLPHDFFAGFRNHPSLRQLTISSTAGFHSRHLRSFNRIQFLTLSGCQSFGPEVSFDDIRDLRYFRYLGNGLTVGSLCNLFASAPLLRKVSLDTAPDQTVCRRPYAPPSRNLREREPSELVPHMDRNVYDHSVPNWVLPYILSRSPPTMESLAMLGRIATEADYGDGFPGGYQPRIKSLYNLAKPYGSYVVRQAMGQFVSPRLWQHALVCCRVVLLCIYANMLNLLRGQVSVGRGRSPTENRKPNLQGEPAECAAPGGSIRPANPFHNPEVGAATSEARGTNAHSDSRMLIAPNSPASGCVSQESGSTAQEVQRDASHNSVTLDLAGLMRLSETTTLISNAGAKGGTRSPQSASRLSSAQRSWLEAVTGGRLVSLDV